MNKGEIIHGFELISLEDIENYNSIGYIFKHLKSGANLFYMANDDTNRVFYIAFKTPPKDDCGTPHILEHSVLCGSQKYKCKDPFNELAKGSLNTYLNAMTYSDKTMYPVASTNEKDFKNLMDVYLDAVFNPMIYDKKEIFMQEGWHYKLENQNESITYNGVVYNEMKGALSSGEGVLSGHISKSLFPTSPYGFESGGEPSAIPNLTYEDFIDFHKKYYSPSNSFIYLYGDLNIENYLKYLNEEYLNKYDFSLPKSDIQHETQYISVNVVRETFSSSDQDGKGYFSYNFVGGDCTDGETVLGLEILNYILLGTNGSPLKKALIDGEIADDIVGWYDTSTLETVFSIVAKKADLNKEDKFKEIIETTLNKIAVEGIDEDIKNSALNAWEFYINEEDFGYKPKGLAYGITSMLSWLHGENPCKRLNRIGDFESIKSKCGDKFFENLIEKYLLDNKHSSLVIISPEFEKQKKQEDEITKKLYDFKNSLTAEQINVVMAETENLKNYQNQENQEEVNKIPLLEIDDIDKKAKVITADKVNINGNDIIFTQLNSKSILYFKLMFSLENLPKELIGYAGILSKILSNINTKKYSYSEIATEIDFYIGDLNFSTNIFSLKEGYLPCFCVNSSVLSRNTEKCFEIINEILLNSDYNDKENILKTLKQEKIRFEKSINNNGHIFSMDRSQSYLFEDKKYNQLLKGIDFYYLLCQIILDIESNWESVKQKISRTAKIIFNINNLKTSLGSEKDNLEVFAKALNSAMGMYDDSKSENCKIDFGKDLKKEGIVTASKVVYNSKSANFKDYGYIYSGKISVLQNIINLEYLWNKVRVEGGAYGSGCVFRRNGVMSCYSYRDPNLAETYETYNNIGGFLENFKADQRQIRKYIIGTISDKDKPLHISSEAESSVIRYFAGITQEDIQRERNEILSVTEKDIKTFSKLFKEFSSTDFICSVGSKSKIEKSKYMFDDIKTIED